MKSILLASILFAGQSFAQDVGDYIDLIKTLPSLSNAKVETDYGPQFAAVQPVSHLTFSYRSCSARRFEAEITNIDNVIVVAVQETMLVDCFGPLISRDYQIQVSSDTPQNARFVVLNPVEEVVVQDDPVMCTMIAGTLVHKDTRECVFFSNGCEMATLMDNGYVYPEGTECGVL